jgi:O-antigen/teichoic acid export membrane protein
MSNLRIQTLWSMMPLLVTSVISVISVPLYFRVLGSDMYAMWFYIGTMTGALGFMDLGIGVAVGRFIGVALGRKDTQAVREYWATGNALVLPLVLFFAAVFVTVGAIWGPHWFKIGISERSCFRWAIFFSGIGLFFNYYGQMWNVLAQAHLDFKYLSMLRTWVGLATTVGILIVALLTRNLALIFLYSTLLAALQFTLLLRRGEKKYGLPVLHPSDFSRKRLLEMLPYTMKTFGQLLSSSIIGSLDRIILGRLAPSGDFAAYGASQNVGGRLAGLSVAIMGPIFHNTTRGVGGDATKKPGDIFRESFALMFPWYSLVIVCVFFWSGSITYLWLGAKYGITVAVAFPWIVAALSIAAIGNISGAQLGGLDRVGTGLILQTLSGLLAGACVWIGWKISGLAGASLGFLISKSPCLIQDVLVRKWVGIPMREYWSNVLTILRQIMIMGVFWLIANSYALPKTIMIAVIILSVVASSIVELIIFTQVKKNTLSA